MKNPGCALMSVGCLLTIFVPIAMLIALVVIGAIVG